SSATGEPAEWCRWPLLGFSPAESPVAHERDGLAIDAGLAHQKTPQGLDDAGLTGEPGVEAGAGRFERRIPQEFGVDVDLVDLLSGCGNRVVDRTRVTRDPASHRGLEQGAGRRSVAGQPGELGARREAHGEPVCGIRDLDEGASPAPGGQRFEDGADRGCRGLVTGEQQLSRLARVPVDADARVDAARVGADDDELVAHPGAAEPAGGWTAVTVGDQ